MNYYDTISQFQRGFGIVGARTALFRKPIREGIFKSKEIMCRKDH
jgi:hypothetical protein